MTMNANKAFKNLSVSEKGKLQVQATILKDRYYQQKESYDGIFFLI